MTFAADVADVVVIGGGAAGCALAHRISADPSVRVLLLEAGPDERPDVLSAPARWPETLGGRYDYGYISTPQAAVGGRVVPAPRGRVLGGTTRLNAMIFSFPTEEDLEDWGPLWSRDTVEPSLRAMESHGGPTPGRGAAGPVRNRTARPGHTLCASFVDAAVEAGHPHCEDLNAPGARGAGWFDLTIDDDGSRVDASSSYLDGVRDRDNLQVWADCRVSRLNLSADRVTALTLERRGVPQTLAISGEVVLSAGAIDSPALLLRSGIGPREELEETGVASVLDLPQVGRNLHDHPALPVVWSTGRQLAPPTQQFAETCLYLPHDERAEGRTVSIAFHHVALTPAGVEPLENGATALIGLYEPSSRGTLTLDPTDIDGPPRIDPGYLTDARDVDALAAAVAIVRELAAQPALASYDLKEVLPGPAHVDPAALRRVVRDHAIGYAHHAGTCAMRTAASPGVVDERLRVHGTANLRVADASIIPTLPQVAPSVLAQLIGWRGAELLAEDLRPEAAASLPISPVSPAIGAH
jgi:choline dehydrogenase